MRPLVPIFIGGTGRSGTTILRRVLATHVHVAAFDHELRFFVDPGGLTDFAYDLTERWSPTRASAAVHRLRATIRHHTSGVRIRKRAFRAWDALWPAVDSLIEEAVWYRGEKRKDFFEAGPLAPEVATRLLGGFASDIYRGLNPEARCFVEDTPPNVDLSADLFRWFPNAVVVHVYRDPFDVLASYRDQWWGGDRFWVSAERIRRILESALEKNVSLSLQLESLVADPGPAIRSVCELAGVEAERVDASSITADRAHIGRWRDSFTRTEQEEARRILGPIRERLGYGK